MHIAIQLLLDWLFCFNSVQVAVAQGDSLVHYEDGPNRTLQVGVNAFCCSKWGALLLHSCRAEGPACCLPAGCLPARGWLQHLTPTGRLSTGHQPLPAACNHGSQVPEATPGEKHRAFTVNCEWGSLASWLETLLPEDELPSPSGSTSVGSISSWNSNSSSAPRKGEPGRAGRRGGGAEGLRLDRHSTQQRCCVVWLVKGDCSRSTPTYPKLSHPTPLCLRRLDAAPQRQPPARHLAGRQQRAQRRCAAGRGE